MNLQVNRSPVEDCVSFVKLYIHDDQHGLIVTVTESVPSARKIMSKDA